MKTTYAWDFAAHDNGGKSQYFTVKAASRQEAEKKAFEKARKNAKGDITSWSLKLRNSF